MAKPLITRLRNLVRSRYSVLIIGSVLIVASISSVAAVTYDYTSNLQSSEDGTTVAQAGDKLPLASSPNTTAKTESPVTTPVTTSPIATKKSTTPTASTPTPTQTTPPASNPVVTPPVVRPATISFSTDGCMVTATGNAGYKFTAGARILNKGGDIEYTLPANGLLTVSSGGRAGYTSYGYVKDGNGNQLTYASAPVTASTCPIPSVP